METHFLNLSKALILKGHKVIFATRLFNPDVFLFKRRKKIRLKFVSTPFAKKITLFRLSTLFSLLTWPFRIGFRSTDVIYTIELSRLTPFYRFFLKKNGQLIWNPIGNPKDAAAIFHQFGKKFLDQGLINGIIVESSIHIQYIKGYEHLITVIPHLSNLGKTRRINRKLSSRFRLAFLGRLDENKGVLRLLEAFRKMNDKNCSLTYYGSGILKKTLVQKVQKFDLTDRVFFRSGWKNLEDLDIIHQEIDLAVLFSYSEGLPLTLIECLAYGTPFIATDVGAIALLNAPPMTKIVPADSTKLTEELTNFVQTLQKHGINREVLYNKFNKEYKQSIILNKYFSALGLN